MRVKRAGNHFKVVGRGERVLSRHSTKKAAQRASKRKKG